jgi:multidrug transporter EmrE-like cation transporter
MIKTLFVLIVYAVTSSLGLALLKMAFNKCGADGLLTLMTEWRFWVGTLLYGSGFIIWLVLLKLNNLSTIFACAAGTLIVLSALLGHFYLDEALTIKMMLGMLLIMSGIYMLTVK